MARHALPLFLVLAAVAVLAGVMALGCANAPHGPPAAAYGWDDRHDPHTQRS